MSKGRITCIGQVYRPASFIDRFRVAARKVIYFQKRIAKKGPSYSNCNERQSSCTRRQAQPRLGCPNCEFTVQYKIFRKELDEELKTLKRSTRKGARRWPSQMLLKLIVEVATIANSTEGQDPNWTVNVSNLVSVYRSEEAKKRAIDDYIPPNNPEGKTGPLIPDGD